MLERVLITGYNGALAQRLKLILEKEYELIYLTSNKKSVNNKITKNVFFVSAKEKVGLDDLCENIIEYLRQL